MDERRGGAGEYLLAAAYVIPEQAAAPSIVDRPWLAHAAHLVGGGIGVSGGDVGDQSRIDVEAACVWQSFARQQLPALGIASDERGIEGTAAKIEHKDVRADRERRSDR